MMEIVIISLGQLLDVNEARPIGGALQYLKAKFNLSNESIPALQQELVGAVVQLQTAFNTGQYLNWEQYFSALLEKSASLKSFNQQDPELSDAIKNAFNSMIIIPHTLQNTINELRQLQNTRIYWYSDTNYTHYEYLKMQGLPIESSANAQPTLYGMPIYFSFQCSKVRDTLLPFIIENIYDQRASSPFNNNNPIEKISIILADPNDIQNAELKAAEEQKIANIRQNIQNAVIIMKNKDTSLRQAIEKRAPTEEHIIEKDYTFH
jgi:hypothetical protein